MSKLPKKKIGITGSMGSGKSQVSSFIESLGYPVCDLDALNSQLLKKGNLGYQAFVQESWIVLDKQGEIDKQEMAKSIFSSSLIKEKVESILHPLLLEQSMAWMERQESSLVFVEVPLLFEGGWQEHFDSIWCVVTSQDIALERLMKYRGFTKDQALARIGHQMDPSIKMERSDYVLYNEDSLDSLLQQVKKGIEKEKE